MVVRGLPCFQLGRRGRGQRRNLRRRRQQDRPGLVGLSEDFQIVDERVSARIIRELAEDWLRNNPEALLDYVQSGTQPHDVVGQAV